MRNANKNAKLLKKMGILLATTVAVLIALSGSVFSASSTPVQNETHFIAEEYYRSLDVCPQSEPYNGGGKISCIDICSDGSFLVVFRVEDSFEISTTPYIVEVHDANGVFLYRLDMNPNGSMCAYFDRADGNVVLFFTREKIAIKVDTAGNLLAVQENLSKAQQDALYNNYFLYNDDDFEHETANKTYVLEKNVPITKRTHTGDTFCVTDAEGAVLYRYIPVRRGVEGEEIIWYAITAALAACGIYFSSKKRPD